MQHAHEMSVLLVPEVSIDGARPQQLVVGRVADQLAFFQHQNGVTDRQHGQAVADDEHGASVGDGREVGLDDGFGFGVQGACRLVEDEDGGLGEQGAGDGHALALAAGEVGAALVEGGVVAVGQILDEFVGSGHARGKHDFLERGRGFGGGDVLADGAFEQKAFLEHDADGAAQVGQVEIPHVGAVQGDASLLQRVQALDEPGEGRFAGTRPANDANDRTGRKVKGNIGQGRRHVQGIAEGHAFDADGTGDGRSQASGVVGLFRGAVEDQAEQAHGYGDFLVFVKERDDFAQRGRDERA